MTDNLGCTATLMVSIAEPLTLTLSETHVDVSCNGGANGSIDLTVSGGTSPYTYNWGGGIVTEDRSGLSVGTYTVTVTDNLGCTATLMVSIAEPLTLTLSETHVDVSCNGGSNGSIDLSVSGGTLPYTYNWGGGIVTEDRSGLSVGTYTVTVTDNLGCTATLMVSIAEPTTLTLSETHVDVSCNGGSNGSIDLSVSGGTLPYTYNWGGGIVTEDRSGLIAGTYTVTVTDNLGCTATLMVSIAEPTTLTLSETHVDVSCNGGANGSIDLTVSGGTSPYTYNWGGGVVTEDRSGLIAGNYTVTVTDNLGCTATLMVSIAEPTTLTLSETHVDVSCNGGSNGSIDLTVSGGTLPYTYNWGGGIVTEDRSGLIAGNYTVTVTDNLGCTATLMVSIAEPLTLTLSETHVDVSCNGGANGSIDLTVSGGTLPYTYNWGGGVLTEDRSGLSAGTYTVTVTDNLGCTATLMVSIAEPLTLTLSETHVDVSCNGGSNGSIDLSVSGGTLPYTYNWGGGVVTEDRSGLSAGTYTVTVTDNLGCTATLMVSIAEPIE
ncbi:MAG: SprB repeat-containing protein, partial [Sphingobacteriales bacterium]|nr:SprB repeat-containing protein [Sphingobacteriales bacterium]